MGFFGLSIRRKRSTRQRSWDYEAKRILKITRAVAGKSKVDDEVLDNLEEILITSDVGVDTTVKIIQRIEERIARDKYVSTSELNTVLRAEIATLLTENNTENAEDWDLPTDHKP